MPNLSILYIQTDVMVNVLTMLAVMGIWGISAVSVIMVSQEMEL